ncbi:UNVERIFIED_CONTAM: hypothetical protein FKN15_063627 [Acipenser sinensis]
MPIVKIPVVHRFGIGSQGQQLELQKRIFKKAQEIEDVNKEKDAVHRNLFEITEEFIQYFNNAQEPAEQEYFVDLARKILNRTKHRAGLSSLGSGYHVDLPLAWSELLLLALCRGKIQEESLDVLLVSVDHAPFNPEQLPVLFYIAESILFWVCSDTVHKPYLYTCEVKMLKLGFLVFLRLFVFHLSGHLEEYKKNKSSIKKYLQALVECEPCYQPYPNVLFDVQFIIKSGEIICGSGTFVNDQGTALPSSAGSHLSDTGESGHSINQILWHCLLTWYCVQNNIHQLNQVLQHLLLLREELRHKNWVDSVLGLLVLGEAAKSNMQCLHVLLDLSLELVAQRPDSLQKQEKESVSGLSSCPCQLAHIYSTVLADICLHGCNSEIQKSALVGVNQFSGQKHLNEAGLLCLLKTRNQSEEKAWYVRYSAVHAVVKICHHLHGDTAREGLRNAAWKALQKQQNDEKDGRVVDAVRVAEAEVSGPANPFSNGSLKSPSAPGNSAPSQHVGCRVACMLSQLYLPPADPHLSLLRRPTKQIPPPRASLPKQPAVKKKVTHLSLRKEIQLAEATYNPPTSFNNRTDNDLLKVVEDQWAKELQIKLKEEEEKEQEELEEKQKQQEQLFNEMMWKREEKLNKKTKPYELPGKDSA